MAKILWKSSAGASSSTNLLRMKQFMLCLLLAGLAQTGQAQNKKPEKSKFKPPVVVSDTVAQKAPLPPPPPPPKRPPVIKKDEVKKEKPPTKKD